MERGNLNDNLSLIFKIKYISSIIKMLSCSLMYSLPLYYISL